MNAKAPVFHKGWKLVPERMPIFGDRVGVYDPTGRRRANVPNMGEAKALVNLELRKQARKSRDGNA